MIVKLASTAVAEIVRGFNRNFCRLLPEGVDEAGEYTARPNDRFAAIVLAVPDATYRVVGSEWLIRIERRHFVRAARASEANQYGGDGVVAVPPEDVSNGDGNKAA